MQRESERKQEEERQNEINRKLEEEKFLNFQGTNPGIGKGPMTIQQTPQEYPQREQTINEDIIHLSHSNSGGKIKANENQPIL